MNSSGDSRRGGTDPGAQEDGKQQLHPFVCGLCNCSYGQFASFYKHFKNHSKEVGQDSFHICEDLPSSERDVCEDQPGSLEMQTFKCGICPASFITVCLLHEHMKKHESKGSYTLDMQSNTGYPSSKQHTCVSFGNDGTSTLGTLDDISSDAKVKSIRSRSSKYGPTRTTENKRVGPPNYAQPKFSSADIDVKVRRGSPSKQVSVKDDCSTSGAKNSRPGRLPRRRHMDIKHDKLLDAIKVEPAEMIIETSARNNRDDRQDGANVCFENAAKDSNENDNAMETEDVGMDIDDGENDDIEDGSNDDIEDRSNSADNDADNDADFEAGTETKGEENIKRVPESKGQTMYNFKRKQTLLPQVNSSARMIVSDTRRFLNCEVCGMKKVKHMLVKHVEDTHGRAKLSKGFLELLGELKAATAKTPKKKVTVKKMKDDQLKDADYVPGKTTQNRKRGKSVKKKVTDKLLKDADDVPGKTTQSSKKGNYVNKKVKDEHLKDTDYIPEIEFSWSPPIKVKNVKDDHVMLKIAGIAKRYAECIHCGIALRGDKILKHEKAHNTQAGKLKFAPENMTTCEECGWVLLKTDLQWHKCASVIILERTEPGQERVKKMKKKHQPTPCEVCGVFVKQYLYRSHLLTHSDARPYSCPKCSRAFKTKILLRYHDMNVHGERNFQCDLCPWAFTSKTRLRDHCLKHTEERKFTCTTCGKQFKRCNQLKLHTQRHEENPSYACKECPKVYMSGHTLSQHVSAVHRKQRNWICSWQGCGKRFINSTRLRRHMRIHTGEKPEQCNVCGAAFVQREGLKVHMKQKHNTDEMPPPNPEIPFSGVVPQLIMPPAADDADTDHPDSRTALKTINFTSPKSKPEEEKLRYQLAVQQLSLRRNFPSDHSIVEPVNSDNMSINKEIPFSGVVPQLIMPPAPDDADTDQPNGRTALKTINFTSPKSKPEEEKLRYQLAVQQLSLRRGQTASCTVQSREAYPAETEPWTNKQSCTGYREIKVEAKEGDNEEEEEAATQETISEPWFSDEEEEEEECTEEGATGESGSEPCFSDDQYQQNDADRLTASFMLECNGMSFFRIKK